MKQQFSVENNLIANQFTEEKEYWTKKLQHKIDKTILFTNYFSDSQEHKYLKHKFKLSEVTEKEMLKLSGDSEAKLHIILVAGMVLFLRKYTNHKNIVIGTTIDKQNSGSELVNKVLPLYFDFEDTITFRDLILKSKEVLEEAFQYQNFPLETLINSDEFSDDDEYPLFDIAVIIENLQPIEYLNDTHPSLICSCNKLDNQIEMFFHYNTRKYTLEFIQFTLENFKNLLESIFSDIHQRNDELVKITTNEYAKISKLLDGTKKDYPLTKSIDELFRDQVRNKGNEIAVTFHDEYLTYNELDKRSDIVALEILKRTNKESEIVAIFLERSIEILVSILAIIKSGCAYLPVEINTPVLRVEHYLQNSGAKILISRKNVMHKISPKMLSIVQNGMIEIDELILADTEIDKMPPVSSENLAYVIYTSGSTGLPKGVQISHRNAINLLFALNDAVFKLYTGTQFMGLISPFIFDASIQLCLGAIVFGHRLNIISDEERADGRNLLYALEKYQIHILDGTPTHLNILLQSNILNKVDLSLKHLIIGGDVLHRDTVEKVLDNFKIKPRITNVYGPTECTVNATYYNIEPSILKNLVKIPIGKPFINYQLVILNKDGEICPEGVEGELCIAGEGVAKGYINNDELTNSKFEHNDLQNDIIYRTGDVVKLDFEGNIIFICRKDDQVKIRGYRIELEEIDATIRRNGSIANTITVARDHNSDKELINYFIAKNDISSDNLREYLSKLLPHYMIPSFFIQLDEFPLINGKINKKALPDSLEFTGKGDVIATPTNCTEEQLHEIWKNNLNTDKIGIHDNYFNIGGDSIKLISLLYEINDSFKIQSTVIDLYKYDTISKFAGLIIKKLLNHSGLQLETIENEMIKLKHKIMNDL